ncbi:MAG TPA: phosphotransferase [Polyangiaceae bacterium]|nr:phosphotransferase [Polyangiaceae bacterium]
MQSLWGGYGEIRRATLFTEVATPVIVKYVVPPAADDAARDSAEARSHQRKLRSYQVERAFYESYAAQADAACRLPAPLHLSAQNGRLLFVLEDLDAAGFELRKNRVSPLEVQAGLRWLAAFHATFLNQAPERLWKVGSYWHLATRPDELSALSDAALRRAAPRIDAHLNRARFRTFVHGDAKLQNFCLASAQPAVAAVDFQYVGGGVGVKDVAYFLTSCLSDSELESSAESYLDHYFAELACRVRACSSLTAPVDVAALEVEWRALYPLACADFYRFLLGWAPGSAGQERYLAGVTRAVLRADPTLAR